MDNLEELKQKIQEEEIEAVLNPIGLAIKTLVYEIEQLKNEIKEIKKK